MKFWLYQYPSTASISLTEPQSGPVGVSALEMKTEDHITCADTNWRFLHSSSDAGRMDVNDCRYTTIMQKENMMNQRQAYNVEPRTNLPPKVGLLILLVVRASLFNKNKSPRFQLQDTNATSKANESKSCNSLVHTMSAGFGDFWSLSQVRVSHTSTFRSRWQRKEKIYEKKIRETPCISLHFGWKLKVGRLPKVTHLPSSPRPHAHRVHHNALPQSLEGAWHRDSAESKKGIAKGKQKIKNAGIAKA